MSVRSFIALLFGAVIAAAVAGCTLPSTQSSQSTGTNSMGQASASSTPTAASAGSAVRDGKFEFRVLDVSRAAQAGDPDGNPYEQVKPQGEFIIVTMSVTNIGDEQQSYFGDNQKLVDSSGRQYGTSSEADMWMNSNSGLGDINPGNSIQVKAAFDVPPNAVPSALEVHDSMFSGGATVRLS